MFIDELSETDKRVCLFVKVYEDVRRRHGGFGYKAFKEWTPEIVNHPTFKCFRTVMLWLESQAWKISWNEESWKELIQFIFARMKPSIPQPGQLKNPILVKGYLTSFIENTAESVRSKAELGKLYGRILHPAIKNSRLIYALGLD